MFDELLDDFAMLSSQELCHILGLFFDKLTSFLIQNWLDLLNLSIIVDLDLVHLFVKQVLHGFIHLVSIARGFLIYACNRLLISAICLFESISTA